uniref:Retrovirus-related Pol polyprotein from transposon TNT 1-94 n=1 Tax=Strongyloides stercoralis TaxID=6248 RepID=A0A0K0EMU9_STRER
MILKEAINILRGLNINKLTSKDNYKIWKEDLETLLEALGTDLNEICKNDYKEKKIATQIIKLTLSEELRNQFIDYQLPADIINDIKENYETTSLMTIVTLKRQLYHLKMESESSSDLIAKMKKIIMELQSKDVKVNEEEQVLILLGALPPSYEPMISTLPSNIKLNEIISRLRCQEELKTSEFVENVSFYTKRHRQNRFHRPSLNNQSRKKCYNCSGYGHYADVCPSEKREKANNLEQVKENNVVEDDVSNGIIFSLNSKPNDYWIVDSGASTHITGNLSLLKNVTKHPKIKVKAANGTYIYTDQAGEALINNILFKHIYYSPEIDANLLSYTLLKKSSHISVSDNQELIFNINGNYIFTKSLNGVIVVDNDNQINENKLWHERLGHACSQAMKITINKEYKNCSIFYNENLEILEVISVDLAGPMRTPGLKGERYYFLAVDAATKLSMVIPLISKRDTCKAIQKLIITWENMLKKKIKRIRSDCGTEFLNEEVSGLLVKNQILHEQSAPYTHQQNFCERYNRTIKEITSTLITSKRLPQFLWPQLVESACYIRNRVVSSVTNKIPIVHAGLKANHNQLKSVGSLTIFRDPKSTKLKSKGKIGILVGYGPSHTYKVYDIEKKIVVITCDVSINETKDYVQAVEMYKKYNLCLDEYEDEDDTQTTMKNENEFDTKSSEIISQSSNEKSSKNPRLPLPRDSSPIAGRIRDKKALMIESDLETDLEIEHYAFTSFGDVPNNIHEALKSEIWTSAVNLELNKIEDNRTWEIAKIPHGITPLKTKWVFTRKESGECKARLTAMGCYQNSSPESFAPTACSITIKCLLAISRKNNLLVEQLDVVSAFLQGEMDEIEFVYPPIGYKKTVPHGYALRLRKALYGLKQAARRFYITMSSFLETLELKSTDFDPSLYYKMRTLESGKIIHTFLLLYVDDCLVVSNSQKSIDEICDALSKKFEIKRFGKLGSKTKSFVGLEIEKIGDDYIIHQIGRINNLLNEFKQLNLIPKNSPMNQILLKHDNLQTIPEDLHHTYRSILGKLNYISCNSRPDIMYAVNACAKYANSPKMPHMKALTRILCYLIKTKDIKIKFTDNDCPPIILYADSSFGEKESFKSTYGLLLYIFGSPVYWKSKQLNNTSLSTFESELVALTEGIKIVCWTQKLMKIIDKDKIKPVVYCDNLPVINAVNRDGSCKSRAKHINISYNWLREQIAEIDLKYCSSNSQKADFLTKPTFGTKLTLGEVLEINHHK